MNPLLELLAVGLFITVALLLLTFGFLCIGCLLLVDNRETIRAIFRPRNQCRGNMRVNENET